MLTAFIAATDAAIPKAQNLCDRIKCDTAEKAPTCATNGQQYKVFNNSCQLRLYNCNKGQRKFSILSIPSYFN